VTNRVPLERVATGLKPVCGRCKTPISVDLKPVTVTDATFSDDVERSPVPVLLDLWAPWCGPCRTIAPVLESLALEWAGRVRIAKLNVDENPATASRLNARSIPLLVVIKDGKEVDRLVGVQPRGEIERRLQHVAG
jgi:thioredoxin 2